MALSMLVIFLYGGMVWGIFPIRPEMSWEGHLWGSLAGLLLAFYYKKEGPQKKKYSWELEEETPGSLHLVDESKNEEGPATDISESRIS